MEALSQSPIKSMEFRLVISRELRTLSISLKRLFVAPVFLFLLVDLLTLGPQVLLHLPLNPLRIRARILMEPSDLLLITPDRKSDAVEFNEKRPNDGVVLRFEATKRKAKRGTFVLERRCSLLACLHLKQIPRVLALFRSVLADNRVGHIRDPPT
jgi:hypothetical protein